VTPDQKERLLAAFVEAFADWSALRAMLALRLDIRSDVVGGAGQPISDAVTQLLFVWAPANGRQEELVKAACTHVPHNRPLWQIAQELGWAPEPVASAAEAVASARRGLQDLVALLEKPEIRVEMAAFRAVFDGADARLRLVGDYKDLHDKLHDLQLHGYRPILGTRRTFPQEETRLQLRLDAVTLKRLIEQMRSIVRRPALSPEEFPWIEDGLETARGVLNEAVKDSAGPKLDQAIRLLRDVVQLQPSLVNALLVRAASDLDMPALAARLRVIHQRLEELQANPDELTWFASATAGLERLSEQLRAKVQEHRTWQFIDNDLRLVESAVGYGAEDADVAWQGLKRRLTATDSWPDIEPVAGVFEEALAARSLSTAAMSFSRLHTLAIDRFYGIDKSLKDLCSELRPIGNELNAIVQNLG
jgi:Effector-associated domain 1